LLTGSERPDGELTGEFSDKDRRARFDILARQRAQAEADARKFKAQFDAEIASARRQGQKEIIAEAQRRLAELLERFAA
jgi:hypothetical protein